MLDKHHTKSWTTADGVCLSAEISPCSWMYSGAPPEKDIKALLKKERSANLDDYQVFDLTKEMSS